MTTFKDGDKVRRIAGWNTYGPTEDFGVVETAPWAPITHDNVPIRWADGHLRGAFPRNIELVQEDTVTRTEPKFNVGDRVVYTGNDTVDAKGLIGTVKKIEDAPDTEYGWLVLTDLDRSQAPGVLSYFDQGYARNFSLYTEPVVEEAEESAPTFQGDIFELRERLLALAVNVGDFCSTGGTVVKAARTFENYITGGTK